MFVYSPSPTAGGGSTRDVELADRSPEELIARIAELEQKIEKMRRREIEHRRSREASTVYAATHTHEDGYDVATHQRVAVFVDVQNTLVNNAILRWGSEDLKERYFPKLTSEWVASYALSEPGSGSPSPTPKPASDRGPTGSRAAGAVMVRCGRSPTPCSPLGTLTPASGS